MGRNPTFPLVIENDLPANTSTPISEVVCNNLNNLHSAREAYIKSENSQKLKRAMSHNVRTSNGAKFYTGDQVFYKKDDTREWKGPASVIGQDGQKVLIKHGPYNVSVHPCRVILKDESQHNMFNKGENEVENPVVEAQKGSVSVCDDGIISSDEEETEMTPKIALPDTVINEVDENAGEVNDVKLKKGLNVRVTGLNKQDSVDVRLINRAGKSTGRYKDCWNVEDCLNGDKFHINFEKVDWSPCDTDSYSDQDMVDERESSMIDDTSEVTSEECLVSNKVLELKSDALCKAKLDELQNWKLNNVYEEIENKGQEKISVRWVVTEKVDGENIVKARLCARGFEEIQDFRKDSPTCSKESVRVVLSLASSLGWPLNSLDVKTAFLQGQHFDREVYLKPPREAETTKLWRLNKCVYGLADASRQWYLHLKNKISETGGQVSKYDNGLFFFHNTQGELIGLMSCHVDDILWSGSEVFKTCVVDKLTEVLVIGKTCSEAFKYIGIDMKQNNANKSITISQDSYIKSIKPIELEGSRLLEKDSPLNEKEITLLRGAIGQLNWLACVSRPDVAFDVSVASSNIKGATISEIIQVNKLIKRVKHENSFLNFLGLDLKSLYIKSFADASYNNLKNGGSQGGYVIFLADKNDNCCPIEWKSNRLKRVVRSALASETLACTDCIESDIYWAKVFKEILNMSEQLKIVHHTESKSLIDHLSSQKTVSDRLLRVDMSVIRENIANNNVNIKWVDSKSNVSDVLTKTGVCSKKLLGIFKSGKF